MRKNRFYYYYRLLKWRMLRDRSPISASLKITQRCNLRCCHCAWEKKYEDDCSFDEWQSIIDDLYERGVAVMAVEGGEPTLYPDAQGIVDYIRGKGCYCIFITNGTMDISSINPDVFWISIDGMETSHDRIRGAGSFRKTMQTIAENKGRKIMALVSLSKSNMHDVEALCEFLSPLLSGIIFNFIYPYGEINETVLDVREKRAVAGDLIKLKAQYPKLLNSDSYLSSIGRRKLSHPWLLTTVTSNGKSLQGCMVRHIEQEDCAACDMGCCAELSNAYALRSDSIEFWSRACGLPKLF